MCEKKFKKQTKQSANHQLQVQHLGLYVREVLVRQRSQTISYHSLTIITNSNVKQCSNG